MYTMVLAIVVKGTIEVGGLDKVWAKNDDSRRIEFFNFSLDPTIRHTVGTQILGGIICYIPAYVTNQTQV